MAPKKKSDKKSILDRVGDVVGDAQQEAAKHDLEAQARNLEVEPEEARKSIYGQVAEAIKGQPAEATPAPEPGPRTYTVVAGDTLSHIAQQFYGSAAQWKKIFEANRDKISNPDLIYAGQELVIPD